MGRALFFELSVPFASEALPELQRHLTEKPSPPRFTKSDVSSLEAVSTAPHSQLGKYESVGCHIYLKLLISMNIRRPSLLCVTKPEDLLHTSGSISELARCLSSWTEVVDSTHEVMERRTATSATEAAMAVSTAACKVNNYPQAAVRFGNIFDV